MYSDLLLFLANDNTRITWMNENPLSYLVLHFLLFSKRSTGENGFKKYKKNQYLSCRRNHTTTCRSMIEM